MKNLIPIWDIGTLPFFYTVNKGPGNIGLPDVLPFILGADKDTGLIVQMPNNGVSTALEGAYTDGSMLSGYMDATGIGRRYADDFLEYLLRTVGKENFRDMRILEIGCGTGYLLSRLKALGAEVIGIEPGPQGKEGAERFDLPIINEFFPTNRITGRFDLIIGYALLEHIKSPVSFLTELHNWLAPNATIAISVPDCTPYIEHGDISMLLHEHWSYFTEPTLKSTLKASGYSCTEMRAAGYGGAIYANFTAEVNQNARTIELCRDKSSEAYARLAEINLEIFSHYIKDALSLNETIGIYCPGRAIGALHLLKIKRNPENNLERIRFFDDNTLLHGQFYPGFPCVVESREELYKDPTDRILVFSFTFGRKIAGELSKKLEFSKIITCEELFLTKKTDEQ